MDGIIIPPDFSARPDGTSFWDYLLSFIDQEVRDRLLNNALNEWFSGDNAPAGSENYKKPPQVDYHSKLISAGISHDICKLDSITLSSYSFDIVGMTSGRMVYSANQTWRVIVKYE